MKKIFSTIAVASALTLAATSCVDDLNVTPIDPDIVLPEQVLDSEAAFNQLLAKCYQGLACSASDGQDSSPDISGVDGGYGQYIRAMFHLQCLATDEAVCCWNDQTLYDIHNLCWSTSDVFVAAAYYRCFYQVGLCNEFIRQANETAISDFSHKAQYIAEARALRLLSYYHAIDLFGNVPFATEANSVGSTNPAQISRADLWDWMVTECLDILNGNDLPAAGTTEYGRIDKGGVQMILAKLYLNAEIWKGENHYKDCADVCQKLMSVYTLHDKYLDLFSADNHLFTKTSTYGGDELIFVVPQDGINICSYGATNYIIFASTGADMDPTAQMGISSGWSGLTLTEAFVKKFEAGDVRANFYTELGAEIVDLTDFKSGGYKSMKYRNINHDGTTAQAAGFVDTDFPVFRAADVYLMLAECAARGAADKSAGLKAANDVRNRAGLASWTAADLTLENLIDERGRELYHELVRRQDLVRFGMFTTDKYLWDFKGGVREGKAVDSKYNLYPLTSSDVNANGNLTQNEGYN